jgi:murein DD-endopeptidase MepM/ murein hydrolase activator NlpD
VLLAAFVAAAVFSFLSTRALPLFDFRGVWSWLSLAARALVLLLLVALVVLSLGARGFEGEALAFDFPLRGPKTFYVAQGGGNAAVNYHGVASASQAYALDIVALDRLGRKSEGLYPADLSRHAAYGETVYSPCDGEVVAAFGDAPDNRPPDTDAARPAGNHVWIRQGDSGNTYVVLAHLMRGSVEVRAGERVRRGQPIARVGNSGNTTEPHLHLQVQTGPDLLHPDGRIVSDLKTVSMSFYGAERVRGGQRAEARDLRRNDLVVFG